MMRLTSLTASITPAVGVDEGLADVAQLEDVRARARRGRWPGAASRSPSVTPPEELPVDEPDDLVRQHTDQQDDDDAGEDPVDVGRVCRRP